MKDKQVERVFNKGLCKYLLRALNLFTVVPRELQAFIFFSFFNFSCTILSQKEKKEKKNSCTIINWLWSWSFSYSNSFSPFCNNCTSSHTIIVSKLYHPIQYLLFLCLVHKPFGDGVLIRLHKKLIELLFRSKSYKNYATEFAPFQKCF